MQRLLKEPLLHFLLLGGALFVLFGLVGEKGREPGDKTIVVTPGRIERLANLFEKTWRRQPNRKELEGLVEDFVLEEIYYRRAREMGIDR